MVLYLCNTILLLSLLSTYSTSDEPPSPYFNRTITSSRSIYELAQLRRMASRLAAAHQNKTHRHDQPYGDQQVHGKFSDRKKDDIHPFTIDSWNVTNAHHRFFMNRFMVGIITISVIMILIILSVVAFLVMKCERDKNRITAKTIEQIVPLKSSRQTSVMRQTVRRQDPRDFSRKPRTPLTAV